ILFYNKTTGIARFARLRERGASPIVPYCNPIQLAKGWTHIAWYDSGLVFYNQTDPNGLMVTAHFDPSSCTFTSLGSYKPHGCAGFVGDCFPTCSTGFVGDCFPPGSPCTGGWTNMSVVSGNHIFFYGHGCAVTGTIDANGKYQFQRSITQLYDGWTNIVG